MGRILTNPNHMLFIDVLLFGNGTLWELLNTKKIILYYSATHMEIDGQK